MSVYKFSFLANLVVLAILLFSYWFIPEIQGSRLIDLAFLAGCTMWFISSIIRFSNPRLKKNNRVMEYGDPNEVLSSNTWAFTFFIAGIPTIAVSVIISFTFY